MKTVSDPYLLHLVGYVDCLNMQEAIVKMFRQQWETYIRGIYKTSDRREGGWSKSRELPSQK